MLLLKAAEMAEAGEDPDRILPELERIRGQSGIMFTVEVYDNLLASGRVGRGRVLIAGLLDIKPVLGLDAEGRVEPLARVRGSERVVGRILDHIEERAPRSARALRFGLMHVGRPAIIDRLRAEIELRWGRRDILVAPVTPVIATHLGPDAWGIAWQLED
jgi:DegV family protein with EDD domain